MIDGWLIVIFGLAAIPFSVWWVFKRRQENRGHRCWNCGSDLRNVPKRAGRAAPERCPKWGNAIELGDGN